MRMPLNRWDEREFYGEILFFKPDTFEIFSAKAQSKAYTHTHTQEKKECTFNSMFLSKNPKTISIRKLQTSFHFYCLSHTPFQTNRHLLAHIQHSYVNVLWIQKSIVKIAFNFPAEKFTRIFAHFNFLLLGCEAKRHTNNVIIQLVIPNGMDP